MTTNSKLLLNHHQYQSDIKSFKGNLSCIPIEKYDTLLNSITDPEFIKILNNPPEITTEKQYSQLIEIFNEHWLLDYLKKKGITVNKITPKKTVNKEEISSPDFECETTIRDKKQKFYIELKTLDISGGPYGHSLNNEKSLDAAINIENDIIKNPKKRIYSEIIEPDNFGGNFDHEKEIKSLVELLIDKINNNIKESQFINEPTFLFVMIDRFSPGIGERKDLSSYYYDGKYSVVSGIFWTTCLAKEGNLIQGRPKPEGVGNIDGILEKQGVLIDKDYIAGILFGCSFFKEDLEVFGLYKSDLKFNNNKWVSDYTGELFSKITDAYSDETNGKLWDLYKK